MPKVNNGEPPHPNKSCKKQTKQGFFKKKFGFTLHEHALVI